MRTKEYEGVDLYRTEIFLIARGTLTTEDEQHRLYQDLLECLRTRARKLTFQHAKTTMHMTSSGLSTQKIGAGCNRHLTGKLLMPSGFPAIISTLLYSGR